MKQNISTNIQIINFFCNFCIIVQIITNNMPNIFVRINKDQLRPIYSKHLKWHAIN